MKSTLFTSMCPSTPSGLRPPGEAESMTGTRSMVPKIELAAPRAKERDWRFGAICASENAPIKIAKKTARETGQTLLRRRQEANGPLTICPGVASSWMMRVVP